MTGYPAKTNKTVNNNNNKESEASVCVGWPPNTGNKYVHLYIAKNHDFENWPLNTRLLYTGSTVKKY